MINSVTIIGRLTRDAESKFTQSGTCIVSGSIAVEESYTKNNEKVKDTSFFDFQIFGKLGEAIGQYLTKGKQIGIRGKLRQERWEKDGQQRSKILIVVEDLELLSKDSPQSAPPQQNTRGKQDEFKDDVPF